MALIGYGLPKRETDSLGDIRGHNSSLLTVIAETPKTADPSDIASVVSFDSDKDVLIRPVRQRTRRHCRW
jgi:hypothetical protein